jgi:hypothetical protein
VEWRLNKKKNHAYILIVQKSSGHLPRVGLLYYDGSMENRKESVNTRTRPCKDGTC